MQFRQHPKEAEPAHVVTAPDGTKRHLLDSLKWSAAGEWAVRFLQPLILIFLAQLLSPEDFGVMTAAAMVIGFSQVFWETGMGKALIQRREKIRASANVAFWINLASGTAFAVLILIFAEPVARHVFKNETITLVLQVMVVHVLLGAAAATHAALLQRDFHFRRLFKIRLLAVALPALVSIPLAFAGGAYWSLVAGALAGQAVQVVMCWRAHPWRPQWSFDRGVARQMAEFGAWAGLSGLLGWFYVWADALIVGMYLGTSALGLYRTGNQFTVILFGIVLGPLLPVLYSHLSEIQTDRERVKRIYVNVVKASAVVSIPMAFVLFAISEQIEALVFGQAWTGIAGVIGVLGLAHGIAWVVGANGEVYRAMGRPALETTVSTATLVCYLAGYLWGAQYGLGVFLWVRCALAAGATLVHLWLMRQVLVLELVPILTSQAKVIAVSSVAVLVGRFVPLHLEDLFWQLVAIVFVSMSAAGGLLFLSGEGCIVRDLVVGFRERGKL